MTQDWRTFVLAHGRHVATPLLAAVVQQPIETVERFRHQNPCAKSASRTFVDLFTLFHGRAPREDEWPRPYRIGFGNYKWLGPELSLVATLAGTMTTKAIAAILTTRLRDLTGDPAAARKRQAVQNMIIRCGLQASDLVGGLTVREAGMRVGSLTLVNQAIFLKRLRTFRVGHRHVIPRDVFDAWLAARDHAPDGWIRLTTLRRPLGIKSDSKLPEFAKLGYIPDVVFVRASHLWFIKPETAAAIITEAHAGRPLPWHGKPMPDNVKHAWKKWIVRKHRRCAICRRAWGPAGTPRSYADFVRRYPAIDLGLKRHMTRRITARRPWAPTKPWGYHRNHSAQGLTIAEAARELGRPVRWIQNQIVDGVVRAMAHPTDIGAPRRLSLRMVERLRHMPVIERRGRKPGVWLGIHAAAAHAGVSIGTVRKWADAGEVREKVGPRGALFSQSTLETRARTYWTIGKGAHFKRAVPPAWLQGERSEAA